MTKEWSSGKGTSRSRRVGQKEYWLSLSAWQHIMPVWSSLPPKVPTPCSPGSVPKVCPFSIQAMKWASSSVVCTFCLKTGRDSMPERSMRTCARPTIIAEEEDMPEARGRFVETVTSAPRRTSPKFLRSRAQTAAGYPAQWPCQSRVSPS